jgi:hypothetical protein
MRAFSGNGSGPASVARRANHEPDTEAVICPISKQFQLELIANQPVI